MCVLRRNEQGSAKILTIIGILILAVLVYAGVQLFPLYWDHGKLEETVRTTMISALGRRNTEHQVDATRQLLPESNWLIPNPRSPIPDPRSPIPNP